jgi:hypothetical protein
MDGVMQTQSIVITPLGTLEKSPFRKRLGAISNLLAAGFVVLACLWQLGMVNSWDGPADNPLLEFLMAANPLLTLSLAVYMRKRAGTPLPWYGLAFNVCCLTGMGIVLVPYTFAIPHFITLIMALRHKDYYTVLLVPLILGGAWVLHILPL